MRQEKEKINRREEEREEKKEKVLSLFHADTQQVACVCCNNSENDLLNDVRRVRQREGKDRVCSEIRMQTNSEAVKGRKES